VWIAFISFVVFLCLWAFSWDKTRYWTERKFVQSRFRKPRVGVFTIIGMSDGDFQRITRYSRFAPRTWADDLRAEKLQVQEVEATGTFEDIDVLVNPFGERYLESDVGNMRNLKRIEKFVREGGVFVNAGGLAFYYMYDPKSNVEGFTGPMFEFLEGGATNRGYVRCGSPSNRYL